MTKEHIQSLMKKRYTELKFFLGHLSMGTGKTKGSLDCIETNYQTGVKQKGIIITHDATSRDKTWPLEIAKFHPWLLDEIKAKRCHIVHRKDVVKIYGHIFDWVIWDECHKFEPEYQQFFKKNTIKSLIMLTGTLPKDPVILKLLKANVRNNIIHYSVETAIEEKVINDYRLKIIELDMPDAEWQEYLNICKSRQNLQHANIAQLNKAMDGKRMHFIYQNRTKINATYELVERIPNRKLIFCSTKEIADYISPYVYYSGISDDYLQQFIDGKIDTLATAKMLKTGANIPNFDVIVCQQINSQEIDFMQTLARLFRLPVDRIGTIYLFYLKDTQDHYWVTKATIPVPQHKKKVYKLSETSLTKIINDVF